eukprot:g6618.t1
MSLKSGTLPPKAFDKKPKNHGIKYSYVPGVTDTGNSLSKAAKLDSDRVVVKRRGELFKRVRIQTLAQHIREQSINFPSESVYALGSPATGSAYPSAYQQEEPVTPPMGGGGGGASSSTSGVVLVQQYSEAAVGAKWSGGGDGGLLVLDVRDADEFEKCHVQGAKPYPKQLLNHDKISAELYAFKGAENPGKRLVVYDTDDKTTARIATILVEKGFTSLYALSGGFEEQLQSIEHGQQVHADEYAKMTLSRNSVTESVD